MIDTSPLDTANWRKSSYSSPANGCVGVARPAAPIVGIRDTKAPEIGYVAVSQEAFTALLDSIRG